MLHLRESLVAVCLFAICTSHLSAQDQVDTEMVERIKQEGMERSHIMETLSYLTDVHGPRLTGSPNTELAANWTLKQMERWGLENCHLESWGPFGRGWTLEGCMINMVEPHYSPLIAHVKAWSPSTTRTVRGTPVYLDVQKEEDLEKYRGKLGRAIVLISPPRKLDAIFDPPATRKTEGDLLRLANARPPAPRGSGRGGFRRPPTAPPRTAPARTEPANPPTSEEKPPQPKKPEADTPVPEKAAAPAQPAPPAQPPRPDPRSQLQLRADKWQLAYNEGAAVILEPGRGDGGNVFVASVNMPRRSDDQGETSNRFSRGPRPWATESTDIIPQAVMAAEHYNRLVRMIQRGAEPQLEVDILCRYHNNPEADTFNIIAEIPGTDLKDEVVMLGGHFDSWQAGTGATDNAVGCGVALEAIRILKAIDAKPRRTIRIALWTGEEQGLLGSRAYVAQHFGKMVFDSGEEGRDRSRRQRPRPTYHLTAEQEKISAYYNLDNGTGKIRGIYLQGNEQLRSLFRNWLEPFGEMDASTISAGNTGGTDHQSFDALGIPGFQFIQDAVEYNSRTHHSSMDVYDRIQEEDVKQASIIMASFVYHTAMRDALLPRKPLNGKIVKEKDEQPTAVEQEEAELVTEGASTN